MKIDMVPYPGWRFFIDRLGVLRHAQKYEVPERLGLYVDDAALSVADVSYSAGEDHRVTVESPSRFNLIDIKKPKEVRTFRYVRPMLE